MKHLLLPWLWSLLKKTRWCPRDTCWDCRWLREKNRTVKPKERWINVCGIRALHCTSSALVAYLQFVRSFSTYVPRSITHASKNVKSVSLSSREGTPCIESTPNKDGHSFTSTDVSGAVVESGSVDISRLSGEKAGESHLAKKQKCRNPAQRRNCILMHPLSIRMMHPSCIYVKTSHRVFTGSRRRDGKVITFFFLLPNIPMLAIICQTSRSGENWGAHSPTRKQSVRVWIPDLLVLLCVNAAAITYPSSTSPRSGPMLICCEQASSIL